MAELAAPVVPAEFFRAVRDFAIEDAALVSRFLAHAFPGREIDSERFPAEVLQRLAIILRPVSYTHLTLPTILLV